MAERASRVVFFRHSGGARWWVVVAAVGGGKAGGRRSVPPWRGACGAAGRRERGLSGPEQPLRPWRYCRKKKPTKAQYFLARRFLLPVGDLSFLCCSYGELLSDLSCSNQVIRLWRKKEWTVLLQILLS
jgi:hypothetical protein